MTWPSASRAPTPTGTGRARPDGYSSFEWELTPRTDPSPDGYFWSHQFWLVGGEAGYVGLQTLGSEPTGKIAIFSIWDAVTADGPVYVSRFDGEGEGYSVRIPFEWEVGSTYDLRVVAAGPTVGRRSSVRTSSVASRCPCGGRVSATSRSCGPSATPARCPRAPTSPTRSPGSACRPPTGASGRARPDAATTSAEPPGCPGSTVGDAPDGSRPRDGRGPPGLGAGGQPARGRP